VRNGGPPACVLLSPFYRRGHRGKQLSYCWQPAHSLLWHSQQKRTVTLAGDGS